ncbi:MAG: hypothetical protein WAM91_06815 [Candidatus Acidiferrales bacterium]
MVQIDVPAAFAIGSFFADAAHKKLQSGDAAQLYRAAFKNNLFQIFFFLGIPLYFIMNFFGWETTYLWWTSDSVAAYPLFIPVFTLVFLAAGNIGFFLGASLIRGGMVWANRIIYIGIAIYSIIWVFGQTSRTFQVGTYSEWAAHKSVIFYDNKDFLTAFVIVMAIWAIGVVGFFLNLRSDKSSA